MAYTSQWSVRSGEILAIARQVRDANPGAWEALKTPGTDDRRYINLVSVALLAAGINGGVNLKRGGPSQSIDALAFPNVSGCKDSTGTYAGLEIIDIVGGAEGGPASNPTIVWGDVTQATLNKGEIGGWVAGQSSGTGPIPAPQPPPQATVPPGREEALDELKWLDAYYASPEGLQRPHGLSLGGEPDFEGIAAWYLDVYQVARMQMKSRAESRAAVVAAIQQTDEWKLKHR